MAARCRAHDWATTPLGPAAQWPAALRAAVRLMLGAPVATSLWVGAQYTLLYNDAYARILGAKHPGALGRSGAAIWEELWPVLEPQFEGIRGGGPPVFADNALFRMERLEGGRAEEAWFTYALSALTDDAGACLAVYNVAVEFTERARAAHARDVERARLAAVFDQSPSFLAVLRGPDDVFELANDAYYRFVGRGPEILGKPLFDALPETRGHGFEVTHQRVRDTGEAVVVRELPVLLRRTPGAPAEERFIDVTYLPLIEADGTHPAVIAHGADVTDQVRARRDAQRLLAESEAANAQLQEQALELEIANQQLQEQAIELEAHAEELQATAAELEERTEESEEARARAESERARAASILEAMTDAYFALDREFRIVGVNAAMERSTRLARDQLLGRTFWEVFPATVGTAYERHYRAAATEGVTAHFTAAYDDGRLTMVSESDVYPVQGGGVAVFWRDITVRVREAADREALLASERAAHAQAEAARAQSEAVLSSIADAFYLLDREWRFTYVNDAAAPLLQTTRERLIGRTLWDAFPGVVGSVFEGPYREAMATGRPTSVEAYFEPLGTWFDVRSYPWSGGLMVHFRDIGARKVAELERERLLADLQDANAELRRVTAAAQAGERRAGFLADLGHALQPVTEPDAVMETAARRLGEHLGVDRCAYAEVEADEDTFTITGNYTRGDTIDILGRFTFRAFGAEVLRLMRANVAYVVDDAGNDPRVTPPDRAAYEQTQIAAVICVPLHKAGRFVAAMAVHQRVPRAWTPDEVDLVVTVVQRCWESLERARALRRLQESESTLRATSSQLVERTAAAEAAQHAAEAANRAKAEFLATMSHELRTPLNAIQGYTQLIELGVHGPVTDAQHAALARIERAQRHLLGLVTDVLNFASLGAGRVEYDVQPVLVADVVADVLPMVELQLAAKGLTTEVYLPEAGPAGPTGRPPVPVWADREKLGQVFLNLLSNAIKFTPSGGRITVELTTRADGTSAPDVAFFRVADTGIGIPRDKLEAVFQPFVQVRTDYTRDAGGTGLGLAISRDLARGMGGDLRVRSTLGAGSAFTVTLRRVLPDTAAP